jgi:hypothetical protein
MIIDQPTPGERIIARLTGVLAQNSKQGLPAEYDLFFTENGIIFAVIKGSFKNAAATMSYGIGGAIGGVFVASSASAASKTRSQFDDLTAAEIFGQNKKNIYIPYAAITRISFRTNLPGSKEMRIWKNKWNVQCEIQQEQFQTAWNVASVKLNSVMK